MTATEPTTTEELARSLRDVPLVITGAHGFVGLGLLLTLVRAGARPFVLDLAPLKPELARPLALPDVPTFAVDLTDLEALKRVAEQLPPRFVLVHMAALVGTSAALDDAGVRELSTSMSMTLNLLEACGKQIAYLCFVSSIDVFGSPQTLPVTEDHPEHPDRIYGLGKLLAEQAFRAAGATSGFGVSLLRVAHVFGPFEHVGSSTHPGRATRLLPNVLRACLTDKPVTLYGAGEDLRDYVHSYDVAQAVCRAILREAEGTFIVASGRSVTVRQLVETAAQALGVTLKLELKPRSGATLNYRFAIDRARRELGFEPQVDLAAGLVEEAQWMREVGMYV